MKINCLSLVFSLFVLLNIGCSSNENLSEDSEIIDEIIDDDEETEEEEEEEEEETSPYAAIDFSNCFLSFE